MPFPLFVGVFLVFQAVQGLFIYLHSSWTFLSPVAAENSIYGFMATYGLLVAFLFWYVYQFRQSAWEGAAAGVISAIPIVGPWMVFLQVVIKR